jgi:hypothetical protein
MKYAVEMGSCAMIYIPSLIMISSGIQKLMGQYIQTHRKPGDLKRLFFIFQNKESMLKKRQGHAVAQLVEALCYKPEGHRIEF